MKPRLFLIILFIPIMFSSCSIIKAPLTEAHLLQGQDAEAILDYANPITEDLIEGLINRNYNQFSTHFSDAMKSGMDVTDMEIMAGLLAESLGGYQSHNADTVLVTQDHITVIYKITTGNESTATLRVVFSSRGDQQITGLWLDSPQFNE